MQITYEIYMVSDRHGNEDYDVCYESSRGIHISGMRLDDAAMTPKEFEAEGRHLKAWCLENGFEYRHFTKSGTIEF